MNHLLRKYDPRTEFAKNRKTNTRSRFQRMMRGSVCLSCIMVGCLMIEHDQTPGPLIQLSDDQFNRLFDHDRTQLILWDADLERQVAALEAWSRRSHSFKGYMLTADDEQRLLTLWLTIHSLSADVNRICTFYETWYQRKPSDAQSKSHVGSFLLSSAARMLLYEKSARVVQCLTANSNAVRFLNAPHANKGLAPYSLSHFREAYLGTWIRARISSDTQHLHWLDAHVHGRSRAAYWGYDDLWDRVEQHGRRINTTDSVAMALCGLASDLQPVKRMIDRIRYPIQKRIACLIGRMRLRPLGVYLVTQEQRKDADSLLEPGDILLCRKNWRLSNVGLPGFWSHAVLYIGSPSKFNQYFEDRSVRMYLKKRTGRDIGLAEFLRTHYPAFWDQYRQETTTGPCRIIESRRHGVQLASLEAACSDYLAGLRPRLDKVAKAQAMIEAFSHLGKPYDYDFDFATDNALVCTELVWRCYRPGRHKDGLHVPLVTLMRRKRLPANELARLYAREFGRPEHQLDLVLFYDASEREHRAFPGSEAVFRTSYARHAWRLR